MFFSHQVGNHCGKRAGRRQIPLKWVDVFVDEANSCTKRSKPVRLSPCSLVFGTGVSQRQVARQPGARMTGQVLASM